jgi:hypothetical protein
MAHRGGRIIDTDLRISLVLHVSSDGQEREQGSKDDPNVKAHHDERKVAADALRRALGLLEKGGS